MARIIDIQVPDIGDVKEMPVVEIPVTVGDLITAEDIVAVLETDKATLDVPAGVAGRITAIRIGTGDKVSEGSVMMQIEAEDPVAASAPVPLPHTVAMPKAPAPLPVPVAVTSGPPAAIISAITPGALIYASPSIRRYARTLGVNVSDVTGSGPKGRIIREDIEAWVKTRLTANPARSSVLEGLPEWPHVDYAKFGPVDRMPLSRIARIAGPSLARNAIVIPHVTNFDKADVTSLESFRKEINEDPAQTGAKVTLLAFAVKAVVAALKAYPRFNASLEGDDLVIKNYWNIGVAADTPDGLVVPVLKEADRKGVAEIAAEMASLVAAARGGKLSSADMQGATFTISSLGGVGGTNFTPIINAPEVAILGMTRAEIQPVWDGSSFQPRRLQPLALSWDHRATDGVAAARFLVHVARCLSDFRRISL